MVPLLLGVGFVLLAPLKSFSSELSCKLLVGYEGSY